jgi:putative FmdB family regulatory protein
MPTYDYRCPKCDALFEVVQRMKDRPGAKCPKCGAKAVRQLSAGHGLVFKGSGFYITDYKHKEDKSRKAEADSHRPIADSQKPTAESAKPDAGGAPKGKRSGTSSTTSGD